MPECPSCEQSCDTDTGVKLHHYYKHDESIALETSNCLECGDSFKYYPSEKDGKYCELCAKKTPWEWSYNDPGGEDSPHWNREVIDCENCGASLQVKKSKLEGNNFCNKECSTEYRRENWQGESHPLWEGGEIESYGHGWISIRDAARNRDNYKCVMCGMDRDEIGYGPEVHHIKPVREHDKISRAHTMANVICLCPKCHANAEHGNIPREKLYRKI